MMYHKMMNHNIVTSRNNAFFCHNNAFIILIVVKCI